MLETVATEQSAPGLEPAAPLRYNWRYRLLLALLAVAAYGALTQAGYVWDDDDYVLHNDTLRSAAGLGRIWFEMGAIPQYYPLVHTSFWLEYQTWGLNPLGYHLVNLALHTAAATTLAVLVDAIANVPATRRVTPGRIAGILFLVHPVCVESAAWITERKNVLSLFLALLAAVWFFRWYAGGGRRAYAASLLLFVGAMLSKTVVCSLPAVLLVLIWRAGGRIRRRDWLATAPMFVLGLALALVTIWVEKHHVGAQGAEWDFDLGERIAVAGKSCWFYLGKLLWPQPLCFIYPRWQISGTLLQLAPAAAWLALGGGLLAAAKRIGRTPAAVWMIYSGVLFPALGFIDVYPFRYSFVADHFQYHAATVVVAGAAALLWRCASPRAAVAVVTILTAVGAGLTHRHLQAFRNEETLWRHTISVNPDAWIAHNNLGTILKARGELADAEQAFRTAIALYPKHGRAYVNLAVSLDLQGKTQDARDAMETAAALIPDDLQMRKAKLEFHARHHEYEPQLVAAREILLRTPNDAVALQAAANALRHLGHPEHADQLLKAHPGAAP